MESTTYTIFRGTRDTINSILLYTSKKRAYAECNNNAGTEIKVYSSKKSILEFCEYLATPIFAS